MRLHLWGPGKILGTEPQRQGVIRLPLAPLLDRNVIEPQRQGVIRLLLPPLLEGDVSQGAQEPRSVAPRVNSSSHPVFLDLQDICRPALVSLSFLLATPESCALENCHYRLQFCQTSLTLGKGVKYLFCLFPWGRRKKRPKKASSQ